MESEQVFSDFLKKARSWISDDSNAMTILTCVIEENYSPVRDALSWLKEAFKKKAFVAMFFHVVIGGWYTIISKQNPTLVLSKEKVEKFANKANWHCTRLPEDLTYSNGERSTYVLTPVICNE